MFIINILAKCVLLLLGYKLLEKDTFTKVNSHPRLVIVFSHTSYIDFYILLLYRLAYFQELEYLRTLVKPQPFRYAGWLLRLFGAIPATAVEDKNGGSVTRIVNELKQQQHSILLISPKGSIIKRPWRSGYYHIAKQINANIMVAGFDYEKKEIILSNSVSSQLPEDLIKPFLQKKLSEIVPLFPKEEIVPIRPHDTSKRNVISPTRLALIIITLTSIISYFVF